MAFAQALPAFNEKLTSYISFWKFTRVFTLSVVKSLRQLQTAFSQVAGQSETPPWDVYTQHSLQLSGGRSRRSFFEWHVNSTAARALHSVIASI
jgi:hypothetical protein